MSRASLFFASFASFAVVAAIHAGCTQDFGVFEANTGSSGGGSGTAAGTGGASATASGTGGAATTATTGPTTTTGPSTTTGTGGCGPGTEICGGACVDTMTD